MTVADLPYSDEALAFRRRLLDLIAGSPEAVAEEADETELCSRGEAPSSRSIAMTRRLAPVPDRRAEAGQPAAKDAAAVPDEFVPRVPGSLSALGVRDMDVEAIILKFLLNSGPHVGAEIARHIRLPLSLITGLLRQLKEDQLLVYKSSAAAGDFLYELTEVGVARARRYWEHCTYYGATPVSLRDYVASIHAQSVRRQNPKVREIQRVLADISVSREMTVRLAQAVNSGLGLFLYGAPGNGKTLIACRLARAFGETVWVPRALNVGGAIMRLYDPSNHVHQPLPQDAALSAGIDERWIRIRRPTMVVGGELTLDSFEVRTDTTTGVSEAPIQLKSNCGALVIDDFGRQRVPPTDILNRWIVPLAQRFDILSLRNGRKFEFPIDQLVVFATNLEPRSLVDEAFLRRIPYKIDVQNPSEDEFRRLTRKIAEEWGVVCRDEAVDYLIERYYRSCGREMRYCQPGDLLHQVCTYCKVLGLPLEITPEAIDAAAKNYFALL
ncbi:MAG: AAA family ATPase [Pirellulales bacterium]|nr:AAA family ATPase [Pirellulales bacterium]